MPPSAVLSTLDHIWSRLDSSGIPVAIAGGIALSYWGNPRSTQDIDLVTYTDNVDVVKKLLIDAGFKAKHAGEIDLGLFRLIQFEFDPTDAFVTVEIDVMVGDSDYYSRAADRFVRTQLSGVSTPVKVLSREDLILHKVYSQRLIDQADVQQLLEMHSAQLDRPYLDEWSAKLGIQDAFQRALDRCQSD